MRAALVVVALAVHSLAFADTTPPTTINRIMVLEAGDDSYKLFHGAIWLESDKVTWNYRWGGVQCKGRDLSDTSIQLLYASFRAGDQVAVEYVTSEYKGKQYRCVTGFTIAKT